MPNKRQKILSYIIDRENATVEELSRVFRVTPANIRHHLLILTEQGSVKVIGQKTAAGKGRPTQIYSASQVSELNNLDRLADALLVMPEKYNDYLDRNGMMSDIAGKLAAEFITDYSNPTRRLYSAIQSLNHMKYQAGWEAHVENPRIIFKHCPYRAILDKHPELCKMDAYLLENLLGTPVRQTARLVINDKGKLQCIFLLSR